MKFDMNAAWADAMRLVSGNRNVLAVVAGVFFFLPYVVFMMAMGGQMQALEARQGSNPDPQAMMQAMMGFYGDIWWIVLIMAVLQGIGMLGLLALLADSHRPTLGEALQTGLKLFPTYFAAQLLLGLGMALIITIPVGLGIAMGSTGIAVLLGLVGFVAFVYVFTKMSLVMPVIAIERQTNPVTALTRSWGLTKGNSFRIFLFYALIFIVIMVAGIILGIIGGLIFAIGGGAVAATGQALISGLLNAVWVVLFLAVLAAIHRQLAGGSTKALDETFG